MANATSNELQELYVAYFGRAADPAGLDYWEKAGTSKEAFASHMHAQAEFQDLYGSSSVENQVNQIYKNLFDREADAEGLLYWTQQINLGKLQLAEIATDLIFNVRAEGGNADDLAALDNRMNAAVAYTKEVRDNPAAITAYQPLSTSPWSVGVNFQEAKDYLLDIDKDTKHTAAGITASVAVIVSNGTPAAKQTFVLTDNVDTFTGGDGDDVFTGNGGQIDGDTFNGGRGSDTLTVTLVESAAAGDYDNNARFTSKLIETFNLRNTTDIVLDLGDVTGTETINLNRVVGDITLENINEIDNVVLDRHDDGNTSDITLTYDADVVKGTSDSLQVTITNSSNAGTLDIDGIETLNLISTNHPNDDANELSITENGTGTTSETLNISGAGDLDVTTTNAVTITNTDGGDRRVIATTALTSATHTGSGDFDVVLTAATDTTVTAANAATGGTLRATANGAADLTLTGGAGNDVFEMLSTLVYTDADNQDTIVGGAGTDTLSLTASGNAFFTNTGGVDGNISVTGVETLQLVTDGNGDALDFDAFSSPASFTTVIVDSTLTGDDVVLTDVQASTYTIRNLGLALLNAHDLNETELAAAQPSDDNESGLDFLTIDLKDSSGTADAITVNLENRLDGTTNNDLDMTVTTLTAAGVETLTINTTIASTAASQGTWGVAAARATAEDISVTTLTAVDLESLTLTGDADLFIGNALDDECVTVSASTYTGNLDLLMGTNALTYTGGTGEDVIRFASDDLSTTDTITGGTGADMVVATLGSGTVSPTISGVETVRLTFSGGELNATNITDITALQIEASAEDIVVSNLASTATTVTQRSDDGTNDDDLTVRYAAGSAATVTFGIADGDETADTISNVTSTFGNIASLTINGGDDDTGNDANSALSMGVFNADAVLTDLTVTSDQDTQDTVTLGNITAATLTNLTVTADEAAITLGTYVTAANLATINVTATGRGDISIGNIGTTTSADDLTSFVLNNGTDSTGSVVTIGTLNANDADVTTFDVDLGGAYGASTIGAVDADNITNVTIDTGADGTSLVITEFDVSETIGTITINTAEDFTITNGFDVTTSVGNVTIVATDSFTVDSDGEFIDEATTIGNISLTASGAGTGINLGDLDDATSVGTITITANDDVEFDGAAAATTVGNITASVAAGKTIDMNDGTWGKDGVGSTFGSMTVTGGGTFQITVDDVENVGDIDLSGMTTGSVSAIVLNNATEVGITATLGAGADTLTATGGADTITADNGADTITGGGGGDVINLTETVAAVDIVHLSAVTGNGNATGNGLDTITGFTFGAGGDQLNVELLAGGVAAEEAESTAADQNITTATAIVYSDGATGPGSETVADYTNLTDVAAFIEAGVAVATDERFVAIINDLANDKAYVYDVNNDDTIAAIAATDLTHVATLTAANADVAFTIANVAFTA